MPRWRTITRLLAFFPGAAPITLINGDRLPDLLIEHEIGVIKRTATLNDVDADFFPAFEEETSGERFGDL